MFQFKQFTIRQDKCAMKVGTDGVLLGAWAEVKDTKRILDIGAGTGLISLMLAQRSSAQIDAVELNEDAANQAAENVAVSTWSCRINVHTSSIQNFAQQSTQTYDCIVSNPPYFQQSLKSPSEHRSIARHTDELSFGELLTAVDALLSEDGQFSVILPSTESEIFIPLAETLALYCNKKTAVIPREGAAAKRYLMSFCRTKQNLEVDNLVIETNARHVYSEQYIELTKDYYLKF